MCHIMTIHIGCVVAQPRLSIQCGSHLIVGIGAGFVPQDFSHRIGQVHSSSEIASHPATATADGGVDVGVEPNEVHAEYPADLETQDDV